MSDSIPPSTDLLRRLHPADLADQLQRLPTETVTDSLARLPRALAAGALAEMDPEVSRPLVGHLSPELLGELLAELPPASAADLMAALPIGRRHAVLHRVPPAQADSIRTLLRYPEDTAGGIMSNRFIALRGGQTVSAALASLRKRREVRSDDISYLYVTAADDRLLGVVPLRELVFCSPESSIDDIMLRDVKHLRVDDDQEKISREFGHYHYLGLPVLDSDQRLVGIVRASDALKVAQEEATEDMQLMVGLSGEERALTPWPRSVRNRLPWLYINLATAFLAGGVIALFEGTIARWTALAVFLPIIAGQGGNAGMQTLTVVIRDLALGDLSPKDGRKALFKEFMAGLVNGLAVGIVVGAGAYIWKKDVTLGLVAGSAMVLNQLAAALSGVFIPLGLKWLRVDPALASSIFLTTVTDVAGFFFFLGLAYLTLS